MNNSGPDYKCSVVQDNLKDLHKADLDYFVVEDTKVVVDIVDLDNFVVEDTEVVVYIVDLDNFVAEDTEVVVYIVDLDKSIEFGPFSIGRYCINYEMENIGFRRFNKGNSFLSMHFVFYGTAISTIDLQNITKRTATKCFSTKGVHKSTCCL